MKSAAEANSLYTRSPILYMVAPDPRISNYCFPDSHLCQDPIERPSQRNQTRSQCPYALPRLDFTLSGGAIETFAGVVCCIPMGLLARGWARILCSVLADQFFGSHT